MKNCLIIASPRSGSTNLMKSISSAYDIPYCFEKIPLKNIYITKLMAYTKSAKFWIEYCNKWDKVILLGRKNNLEAAQSLSVLRNKKVKIVNEKWHFRDFTGDSFDKAYQDIIDSIKILNECSSTLSIPIDWYEDVYLNRTLSDPSIKLDSIFLDSKHKLRQLDSNLKHFI